MLNVTELRNGAFFKEDNAIWQVLSYEHVKMGRGSGTVKVKVRNLRSGSVTEKGFVTGARVDEAEVERKKTQYLYKDDHIYYFMDPVSFEQFSLSGQLIGDQVKFLKDGMDVDLVVGEGEPLVLELPHSLIYEINDTGPGEKGNTVSSVYKDATLDNGMMVKVPMFMKIGEKIKVDTKTGQYVERVK